MADWEVWRTSDGREVRIRANWLEGLPVCLGDDDVVATVNEALSKLGPYDESITVPELDRDLAASLTAIGLEKIAYIADHDLAAAHLRAAVAQAERSASEELNFETEKAKLSGKPSDENTDVLQIVFVRIALDRAIEASRNAVILAVASLEAFVNQTAALHLKVWEDEEERQGIQTKWILVTRQLTRGRTFDKGTEPYQSFRRLLKLRNDLVHPKATEKRFEGALAGLFSSFYRPSWDAQPSDGRWACVVARKMIIEFSRIVGWDPPRWCAVVPPADPRKPDEWRGAVLLAGARSDPDFPNREWPPRLSGLVDD
jgi:hypothetical protein